MVHVIEPDIYPITVDLPGSPLKFLNSYVVTGGERNLLIDTGYNRPECLALLKSGLDELGLDMSDTDIFVTHLHADHSGLVSQIMSPASEIFMGAHDGQAVTSMVTEPDEHWIPLEQTLIKDGYPREEMARARTHHPGRNYNTGAAFAYTPVEDGDLLPYGGGQLRCVFTPGHTPGHMCLYDPARQILFTGDHLLFDISPNITNWESMPDSLAQYLRSLEKVSKLPVKKTLTGHRENDGDFKARIAELQRHHEGRLADIIQLIAESPGINGYDIASRMKWAIRATSWETFPPGQRWFAVGEALAHLNYLVDSGEIIRTVRDGIHTYTINAPTAQ